MEDLARLETQEEVRILVEQILAGVHHNRPVMVEVVLADPTEGEVVAAMEATAFVVDARSDQEILRSRALDERSDMGHSLTGLLLALHLPRP